MAEKKVKTRIQQKHDLEVNWLQATNFVPMAGEIIIYDKEVNADGNTLNLPEGRTAPYTYERFKIGDGHSTVNELPFTINAHNHICYGVCDAAANNADKTVTVDDFDLVTGAMVIVKFTNNNTAASPTLNVNGTGAKPIRIYGTASAGTVVDVNGWAPGAIQIFIYDGSGWLRDYWRNSKYDYNNAGFGGQIYGICATEASSTLTVPFSSYTPAVGGIVSIKFNYAVPASATLNINSKGAKAIYYRGSPITAGIIKAGDVATFIYNGTYFHLLAIDRWQSDIDTLLANYTKVGQNSTNNNADYSVLLSNSIEDTTNTGIALKSHKLKYNPGTGALHIGELYNYDPDNEYLENYGVGSGTLKVNGDIIASGGDDGYGVMPARCNYGSIGLQENYWWNIYSANVYANSFRKLDGTVPFASTDHTHTTVRSSDTSSKIYLVGTTTQSTNATAYSHDTAYVGADGHLYSNSSKVFSQTYAPEAYLTWGGKNFAASWSPIDAAMIPQFSANRLAFFEKDYIKLEASTDNGATWTEVVNDVLKTNLFSTGGSFRIGNDSSLGIDKSQYMGRITLTTTNARCYTALNKFAIRVSTDGSSGGYMSIDARTKANQDAGNDTWVNFANKAALNGWSGWNIINTEALTTHGNTASQYSQIRFTFGVTSHASTSEYEGLRVLRIMAFGGEGWSTPSNMAADGHLYKYDAVQNAEFPAKVKATEFTGPLNGTAAKATSDANGNNIASTYVTNTALENALSQFTPSNSTQIQIFTWEADD